MNKLVTAKLILQVGSLQFMEAEGLYLFGKSVFYWKFMNSAAIYGPFNSLMEAGEHVDNLMRGPMLPPKTDPNESQLEANKAPGMDNSLTKEKTPNNLITIDFTNKRRI